MKLYCIVLFGIPIWNRILNVILALPFVSFPHLMWESINDTRDCRVKPGNDKVVSMIITFNLGTDPNAKVG